MADPVNLESREEWEERNRIAFVLDALLAVVAVAIDAETRQTSRAEPKPRRPRKLPGPPISEAWGGQSSKKT